MSIERFFFYFNGETDIYSDYEKYSLWPAGYPEWVTSCPKVVMHFRKMNSNSDTMILPEWLWYRYTTTEQRWYSVVTVTRYSIPAADCRVVAQQHCPSLRMSSTPVK